MLMLIYAQNLQTHGKAYALLGSLEPRPSIPPVFVDYARRCIGEWTNSIEPEKKSTEGVESLLVSGTQSKAPPIPINPVRGSVADLLASGHLGTAIEILEAELAERPQDFELWLKLAEAHGRYCRNVTRASAIVAKMEASAAFSPEQIRVARGKLGEWRECR